MESGRLWIRGNRAVPGVFVGGLRDLPQDLYKQARFDAFVQDLAHAGITQLDALGGIAERGQDDDGSVGQLRADLAQNVQPQSIAQHGVDQDQVGAEGERAIQGLMAVLGDGNHFKVRFARETGQHLGAHAEVLVGQQKAKPFHSSRV